MSELTDLYRAPGQTVIFDGDDPALGGWAPHSPHCHETEQVSARYGGHRFICVTSCPRKSQFEKYVLGTIVIPADLIDEYPAAIIHDQGAPTRCVTSQ